MLAISIHFFYFCTVISNRKKLLSLLSKKAERKDKIHKEQNNEHGHHYRKFRQNPSGTHPTRRVGQRLPPLLFPAGFYQSPFYQPHSTRKI